MRAARLTLHRLALASAVVALAGCEVLNPRVDVMQPSQVRPVAGAYTPVNNGSLFQSAGYRPLYESHRARMVGDIITIQISETVSAKQETTSSVEKKGSVDSTITAVPIAPASFGSRRVQERNLRHAPGGRA